MSRGLGLVSQPHAHGYRPPDDQRPLLSQGVSDLFRSARAAAAPSAKSGSTWRRKESKGDHHQQRSTVPGDASERFPCLVGTRTGTAVDQAWATDITDISQPTGFLYLVAMMDHHFRPMLSWKLSSRIDTESRQRLSTPNRKAPVEKFRCCLYNLISLLDCRSKACVIHSLPQQRWCAQQKSKMRRGVIHQVSWFILTQRDASASHKDTLNRSSIHRTSEVSRLHTFRKHSKTPLKICPLPAFIRIFVQTTKLLHSFGEIAVLSSAKEYSFFHSQLL